MRLDPNKALAPHYCDPICITDSKWSDAGLWVDFTDHNPRQFRYGAMGDLAVWDPNSDSDESDWNKRTVTVNPSPFQSETWTHVAMVFSKVNTEKASQFILYINGKPQGTIKDINDPFTWEAKNGKIMLGLGYIGFMDELAIFDKPLDVEAMEEDWRVISWVCTMMRPSCASVSMMVPAGKSCFRVAVKVRRVVPTGINGSFQVSVSPSSTAPEALLTVILCSS